jgi:hypothetical protein
VFRRAIVETSSNGLIVCGLQNIDVVLVSNVERLRTATKVYMYVSVHTYLYTRMHILYGHCAPLTGSESKNSKTRTSLDHELRTRGVSQ